MHVPAACGTLPAQQARVHVELLAIVVTETTLHRSVIASSAASIVLETRNAVRPSGLPLLSTFNMNLRSDSDMANVQEQGWLDDHVCRHSRARRRRRALPITDTELKLIAAAAIMGLSRIPKKG